MVPHSKADKQQQQLCKGLACPVRQLWGEHLGGIPVFQPDSVAVSSVCVLLGTFWKLPARSMPREPGTALQLLLLPTAPLRTPAPRATSTLFLLETDGTSKRFPRIKG